MGEISDQNLEGEKMNNRKTRDLGSKRTYIRQNKRMRKNTSKSLQDKMMTEKHQIKEAKINVNLKDKYLRKRKKNEKKNVIFF